MKKADLMKLVGNYVEVTFVDGTSATGLLGYTEEYSERYHYRKPNRFTIGYWDFCVTHVKHIKILGKEQK